MKKNTRFLQPARNFGTGPLARGGTYQKKFGKYMTLSLSLLRIIKSGVFFTTFACATHAHVAIRNTTAVTLSCRRVTATISLY